MKLTWDVHIFHAFEFHLQQAKQFSKWSGYEQLEIEIKLLINSMAITVNIVINTQVRKRHVRMVCNDMTMTMTF